MPPESILLDQIYAAALGDADWSTVLAGLRERTGSRFAVLMSLDAATLATSVHAVATDDQANLHSMVGAYTGEFHRSDPTPALVAQWGRGRWFLDHEVLTRRTPRHSAYYEDFLKPHGSDNWAGLFLERCAAQNTFLSFVGCEDRPLDPAAQRGIDVLSGHMARALALGRRLGALQLQSALSTRLLDALDGALFLLDESGRLLLDNAAGRAMAAQLGPALCFAGGMLRIATPGWNRAAWDAARASGVLRLPRRDGRPLHLFLTPVPAHAQLAQPWQRPLVLLSAASETAPELRLQRLRAIHGLTEAEAQLALQLHVDGLGPEECALLRGVSLNTVRTQIKSIHLKLGVKRLSAAARHILSL
ncbi:helix-turn-helix transcriptional regulator [Xylophilus rhododendri]|uniref:Helix-turn-helix transcriptional regulator n=1 Tax=Xylophilus rhododendri TaxID=2697032 RepID=A0A857JC62_9BURK|nr:helix-turn-helix transcriptional regulator [Xylophilus rhododendri]QHJ01258.1 helix-turn-helix transcriptional regulator [Xylophilus rhododendri]